MLFLGWLAIHLAGAALLVTLGFVLGAHLPERPRAPRPVSDCLKPGEFRTLLAQDVVARVN